MIDKFWVGTFLYKGDSMTFTNELGEYQMFKVKEILEEEVLFETEGSMIQKYDTLMKEDQEYHIPNTAFFEVDYIDIDDGELIASINITLKNGSSIKLEEK